MIEYIDDYINLIIFRYQESNYISEKSVRMLQWYVDGNCDSGLQEMQIKNILSNI